MHALRRPQWVAGAKVPQRARAFPGHRTRAQATKTSRRFRFWSLLAVRRMLSTLLPTACVQVAHVAARSET